MSDLHNEFSAYTIPKLPGDEKRILILAGDIFTDSMVLGAVEWMKIASEQFYQVIMVYGNHDYYHGNIADSLKERIKLFEEYFDNVHILNNDYRIFDGTVFFGGTLWTDLNDPLHIYNKRYMNDFRYIKRKPGGDLFNTVSWLNQHVETATFIKDYAAFLRQNPQIKQENIVVVTHHAPTSKSIDSRYVGDALNCFYYSNLEETIYDSNIGLWCHGHVHQAKQYEVGDTTVLCNPRGYERDESYANSFREETGFDPFLIIKMENNKPEYISGREVLKTYMRRKRKRELIKWLNQN